MDNQTLPPSRQPKRFFDVLPPSRAQPSATSRPVIVGNRPEQVDTTVTRPAMESTPVQPSNAATEMMQEEYDEIAHELPAGDPEVSTPGTSEVLVPVEAELPILLPPKTSQVVVAHHQSPRMSSLKIALIAVVGLGLMLVILDILLDLNILQASIPHTHLLHH